MNLYKLVILLGGFLCLFSSCNDEQSNSEEIKKEVEVETSLNPYDPIIVNAYTQKGDTIYVLGQKNEQGFAIGISDVIIKSGNDDTTTEILFDESSKPREILANNGVKMLFNWLSDSEAALTLVEPNTGEQLNTIVDFEEKNTNSSKSLSTKEMQTFQKRKGKASLKLEPINSENTKSSIFSRGVYSGPTGNVYIKQCNVPTDAECWVDVYDKSDMTGSFGKGKYRGRFKCVKVGEGHYQYTLPSNYHTQHDIADYCDAINNVMGYVCDVNEALGPVNKQYICLSITAALASGIVSAPVAAMFEAACAGTSAALDLYCGILGFGTGFGGPTIGDGLCSWLRDMDLTWETPLFIVPTVNALPKPIYGYACTYEADGQLRDLEVSWGTDPGINQFYLEPSKPVEGQSYVAIAKLYCLPSGTSVTMNIVGTDGYTDSKNVITGDEIHYQATLNVPGAESGVKDVCTVTIKTPDGSVKTKKASLVFQ